LLEEERAGHAVYHHRLVLQRDDVEGLVVDADRRRGIARVSEMDRYGSGRKGAVHPGLRREETIDDRLEAEAPATAAHVLFGDVIEEDELEGGRKDAVGPGSLQLRVDTARRVGACGEQRHDRRRGIPIARYPVPLDEAARERSQ